MKKLFGYIIGFATILMVFAMIYIVGAMYDAGNRVAVEPYFFRTGMNAVNQVGTPRTMADIGQRKMRDWLIQKFVIEYFYVVPDVENVALRTRGRTNNIGIMADSNVSKYWEKSVVPELRELAGAGVMRRVRVFNEIFKPNGSDYWHVDYELKTWYKPNNMNEVPEITRGTMYIKLQNDDIVGQLKSNIEEVQKWLFAGYDPAAVFVFRVTDIQFDRKQ